MLQLTLEDFGGRVLTDRSCRGTSSMAFDTPRHVLLALKGRPQCPSSGNGFAESNTALTCGEWEPRGATNGTRNLVWNLHLASDATLGHTQATYGYAAFARTACLLNDTFGSPILGFAHVTNSWCDHAPWRKAHEAERRARTQRQTTDCSRTPARSVTHGRN